MYLTQRVVQAMKISYAAHDGQYDKSGAPYIFHPYRVADNMERYRYAYGKTLDRESLTVVALFHDIVEDRYETIEHFQCALRVYGFAMSADELRWLVALTRKDAESYHDFITRTMQEPESRVIKLEDVKDNLGRELVGAPLPASLVERYEKAYNRLTGLTRCGDHAECVVSSTKV